MFIDVVEYNNRTQHNVMSVCMHASYMNVCMPYVCMIHMHTHTYTYAHSGDRT